MKWIILLIALGLLIFALGARFGAGRNNASVAFVPVSDLASDVRASIERDLASGLKIRAVKTYRRATGASIPAAKSAIDIHERKITGTSGSDS